jgi:hypothetical protein
VSTPAPDRFPEPDGIAPVEPPRYAWDVLGAPGESPDGTPASPAVRRVVRRARSVPDVAPPATLRALLRTVAYELSGARSAAPAGLLAGRVLGAVGLGGALVSLLLGLLLLGLQVRVGAVAAAVVLVGFLVVTVAGYLRFRRDPGAD